MSDLIDRLKEHIATLPDGSPVRPLFDETVAEIEQLRAVAGKATAAGADLAAIKQQPKKHK